MESPLSRVAEAVERFGLVDPDDRIVVGFSGGPDSVFLALVLSHLFPSVELHLAHLHHGLRKSAEFDAVFALEFASTSGIPITLEKVDVRALAREMGVGLEEAGRFTRYRFFREIKEKLGFTKIATGHTLSDWLETYLMNIFRGSGLRGARGIPPKEGELIRPLILVEKEEIISWLKDTAERMEKDTGMPKPKKWFKHIEKEELYVEDESNLDTRFTRNWVRHELLPLVKKRFPGHTDALRRHIFTMNEAWDHIRAEAIAAAHETERPSPPGERIFNRDRLLVYNSFLFKMMILEMMPGLSSRHLDDLVALLERGGETHLPGGWKAQASESDLRFFQNNLPGWDGELVVDQEGMYPVPYLNLALEVIKGNAGEAPLSATFPESILPFTLRTRRPGDRWGKKPLKDRMISLRIPAWRRDLIPLVVKENQVLWIPGFARWRMRGRGDLILRIRRLSDEFWVHDF